MHRRILVSIAALAVTSTVAALAVNTNMGSSVTEPVAEQGSFKKSVGRVQQVTTNTANLISHPTYGFD